MELLAWTAEAQLYSLARLRRDERVAYAALFGITPQGPRPASGLIWPDTVDLSSAGSLAQRSLVIEEDDVVQSASGTAAPFHALRRILWVPSALSSVRTRFAIGREIDHTASNTRAKIPFEPFGPAAGAADTLILGVDCRADAGLFPVRREDADGAYLAVGVRVDASATASLDAPGTAEMHALRVTLDDGAQRARCPLVLDSTRSFLRSGICLIDVSRVHGSPARFNLEFSVTGGSARPPSILQIALNVLPVVQGRRVVREPHPASGLPDQTVAMDVPGLRYGPQVDPVGIEVDDGVRVTPWHPVDDLSLSGPEDLVARIDVDREAIQFGNGINGRAPPPGAQILVTYSVCEGDAGNGVRGQSWRVAGLSGAYGRNIDAVAGGQAATAEADRRRAARLVARQSCPLVTAADVESAALALEDLDVGRVQVIPPTALTQERDVTTLLAMRRRAGAEPRTAPETDRWLAAVAVRLAPRLMLGRRLRVIAPRYVDFNIAATVTTAVGADPALVQKAISAQLVQRMRLTDPNGDSHQRRVGLAVSRRDVSAWLRGVPGVAQVKDVQLKAGSGATLDSIAVGPRGLPRLDLDTSVITLIRTSAGRS
jgi:hypothetical protein